MARFLAFLFAVALAGCASAPPPQSVVVHQVVYVDRTTPPGTYARHYPRRSHPDRFHPVPPRARPKPPPSCTPHPGCGPQQADRPAKRKPRKPPRVRTEPSSPPVRVDHPAPTKRRRDQGTEIVAADTRTSGKNP